MEFNEIHTNEVLGPIEVDFFGDRSRTPSPAPVLTTNALSDLEDILTDVSTNNVFYRFILLFKLYFNLQLCNAA